MDFSSFQLLMAVCGYTSGLMLKEVLCLLLGHDAALAIFKESLYVSVQKTNKQKNSKMSFQKNLNIPFLAQLSP